MAEEKKRHHKQRVNPMVSGPQFSHVFGGGFYLGPSWLGYATAQEPNEPAEGSAADVAEDAAEAAPTGGGAP